MSKIKEKVGSRGLEIPKGMLEESGFSEGMSVIIEPVAGALRIVPEALNAAAIRKTALRYLLHHVGDAVDVSVPRRAGDKWQVDVALSHRQACLGVLTYTGSGVLLPEESTSPEEMIQRLMKLDVPCQRMHRCAASAGCWSLTGEGNGASSKSFLRHHDCQ